MNYSKVSDLCSKLLAKTFKLTLKGKHLKRIITYLNNSNNCYKKIIFCKLGFSKSKENKNKKKLLL